ncbi:MAG TPA: Smr/MutS family protein [Rhodocyclaceae bacterium]|nr:Smr/MutS family protein [Rhodocyclaceae bacterium]HMV53548.1 Smr/MutS family protein [Rhodocyclaceae bacterium]HNA02602.1 Smr/MutS family protein [Rhodocyclaceae bacterium]HNB77131.1 Smr/MutS family protein [Rhodocyclaceae bacterium]HNC60178.1 Smr/MutS family protein [Rhodocyclaceae bacterium]
MAKYPPSAPSAEDTALFREAVADATRIVSDRVHHQPPPPRPIPRQRRADERAVLEESLHDLPTLDLALEGGDEPNYLREGLPRSVLRDLRRGRWVVQDQIDLHGATRTVARELLAGFLAHALRRDLRCLRVIHGKGLGSPGREPVLKGLVRSWLIARQEVLAYCQARSHDGGAGALIVLLRGNKNGAA